MKPNYDMRWYNPPYQILELANGNQDLTSRAKPHHDWMTHIIGDLAQFQYTEGHLQELPIGSMGKKGGGVVAAIKIMRQGHKPIYTVDVKEENVVRDAKKTLM